tara:strand:- start:250 stop:1380 length:1131 start_codon:yes stop_codon:yes gene_type:complete
MQIQYCSKCVQINTRPGLELNEAGVCAPCLYFDLLNNINWHKRDAQLNNHVLWAKQNKCFEGYDCVISVSGGKDSTRLAMYARDTLGLNPLLVSTMIPPEMVTDVGIKNINNLNRLGFDIITVEPDPITYKKLMKQAFIKFGNYVKATELVLYVSAPKVAIMYGIKMLFLGENGSLVYGDILSNKDGGNAIDMIDTNTLNGGDISWVNSAEVKLNDLFPYQYPTKKRLSDFGIKIVYLGYYIRDFNNLVNGRLAIKNGMTIRSELQEETGAIFNFDQLDEDFIHINQMIKFFKFGFGKATDEACELIRLGQMTRSDAIKVINKIDGKCDEKFIKLFCKYLEITIEDFWNIANTFRNPKLWERTKNGWKKSFSIESS